MPLKDALIVTAVSGATMLNVGTFNQAYKV
jgi:hypothetical protein